MSLRVYLCGSVAQRSTREVREEREHAAALIRQQGWMPVDPLAGEYRALKYQRKIEDSDAGLTPASLVNKDRFAIDNVTCLLWLTADVPSYGSCIEVGYAWAKGLPIISVDPSKRGRRSAFVAHCSTFIATSLEEAINFIVDYLAYIVEDDFEERKG